MSARNLELQRLLASLNGTFAGAANQSEPQPVADKQFQSIGVSELESSALLRGDGSQRFSSRPQQQLLRSTNNEVQRPNSATPVVQIPDVSTITTWPAALKHMTKYLIPNEKVMSRIRHLINEQHKHEQEWWAQRQAIVSKHAARAGNQSKVADILKNLGGLAVPMAQVDEAADKNELETFDKKVYKSMVQMAADFDGQLRKMGVPFFAIRHDFVVDCPQKSEDGGSIMKLDKGKLRELQRRTIQHLEDLLSDD